MLQDPVHKSLMGVSGSRSEPGSGGWRGAAESSTVGSTVESASDCRIFSSNMRLFDWIGWKAKSLDSFTWLGLGGIHMRYILFLSVYPQNFPSIERVKSLLPGC